MDVKGSSCKKMPINNLYFKEYRQVLKEGTCQSQCYLCILHGKQQPIIYEYKYCNNILTQTFLVLDFTPYIDKIPFILYKNVFAPPFSLSFWLFISLSLGS